MTTKSITKFLKWGSIALLALSLYAMLVDKHLLPGIIPCAKSEQVNSILASIAGSYIAGLIFFVITSTIPNWFKQKQIRPILRDFESRIEAWTIVLQLPISEFKQIIEKYDEEKTFLYSRDQEYKDVNNRLKEINDDIKPQYDLAIRNLFKYTNYLSVEQLALLERVSNSTFFLFTQRYCDREQISVTDLKALTGTFTDFQNTVKELYS